MSDGASTKHAAAPTPSGVNVHEAEHDFQQLSKQLSRQLSNPANEKNGYSSARSSRDVELGEMADGPPFDLREYLTASNDANDKAGIKHKVCDLARFRRS